MAAPQGGYPPQEGYGQQPGYGTPASPIQQTAGLAPGAHSQHAGGKKKRAYAGEAFEFGSGANAALGGQPLAGGAYGAPPPQPQPMVYQQPVYGADPSQIQPAISGYAPPAASGVAQMTQQFSAMGVADPHQMPQQPGQAPPRPAIPLNQLYPTDLIAQPFNVAELDYPPPPIVLPPNVSFHVLACVSQRRLRLSRQVFTHHPMRTVPQSMYGRPLMLFRLRTLF